MHAVLGQERCCTKTKLNHRDFINEDPVRFHEKPNGNANPNFYLISLMFTCLVEVEPAVE
jgi:hypothetical protein